LRIVKQLLHGAARHFPAGAFVLSRKVEGYMPEKIRRAASTRAVDVSGSRWAEKDETEFMTAIRMGAAAS